MNIDSKYEFYSIEDFLTDDSFIAWQLSGDSNSELYWAEVLKYYPNQVNNINSAIRVLKSMSINYNMLSSSDENKMLETIISRYRKNKRKKIIWETISIAASILLFTLLTPFISFQSKKDNLNTYMQNISHQIDSINDIQLIIGNKDTILIKEDADVKWTEQNNITIAGRTSGKTFSSSIDKESKYNTLLVPNGKRSFMELQDGSKMWINSGTKVCFPDNMLIGKERKIYIDGEIYIEVTKDNNRPFIVQTSNFDVVVHGTKFNITSYKDDNQKSVVLVDGSVSVCKKTNNSIEKYLLPNQMYCENEQEITISNVNAKKYISWYKGIFQLETAKLGEIAKRLSRYYGIDIICDSSLLNKTCSGTLVLFSDVNLTLQTLKRIFNIKYDIIDNNKISINP